MGGLLEQWVELQLLRSARLPGRRWKIWFWRDADGPEVDWVLEVEGRYVPFEVKWTEAPGRADARGLQIFLDEHRQATHGVVVARVPRPLKLGPRIVAIPWQELDRYLEEPA